MKILIIGATEAALAAAARLRRLDEGALIVLIDHRSNVLGLEALQGYDIDIRLDTQVIWPEVPKDSLDLKSGGNTYSENYNKLLVSYEVDKGFFPPVKSCFANVFNLSNFDLFNSQWQEVDRFIAQNRPQTAIIRGGDMVGVLAATRLLAHGVRVNLISEEAVPSDLDRDIAGHVTKFLQSRGLRLAKSESEVVMIADIGLNCRHMPMPKPPEFAALPFGLYKTQELFVNTIVNNSFTGEAVDAPALARAKGRAAADEAVVGPLKLFKRDRSVKTTINLQFVEIFGKQLAVFGLGEKELSEQRLAYMYSIVPVADGFLKLIYDNFGKILGFTAWGRSIKQYVDIMAVTVQLGGDIYNLTTMETLGGRALEILGKISQNVVEKRLCVAYWDEVSEVDFERTTLLDVRNSESFEAWHIGGSLNIPLGDLRNKLVFLDGRKEIITICDTGRESYLAARILAVHVDNVRYLTGGLTYCREILG